VARASPWKGIAQLQETLQQHSRFSEALRLLKEETRFVSAASLFKDLDQICDAMEVRSNAASMTDAAHARLSVVERLVADGKVEEAKIELARATQVRERLARDFGQESIKRLDHYIDIATFIINLPDSAEKRRAQFLEFTNTAHKLKDYVSIL